MCLEYFPEHRPNIINNQKFFVYPILHRWEVNIPQQNSDLTIWEGGRAMQVNLKNTLFGTSEYYISSPSESVCLRDRYNSWHAT